MVNRGLSQFYSERLLLYFISFHKGIYVLFNDRPCKTGSLGYSYLLTSVLIAAYMALVTYIFTVKGICGKCRVL